MSTDRQALADRLHGVVAPQPRRPAHRRRDGPDAGARVGALGAGVRRAPDDRPAGGGRGCALADDVRGLVDGLQADGLARRVGAPGDRRAVVVEATPRGRRLLQRGRRRRVGLLGDALADLAAADLDVLARSADLMQAAARRIAAATG